MDEKVEGRCINDLMIGLVVISVIIVGVGIRVVMS